MIHAARKAFHRAMAVYYGEVPDWEGFVAVCKKEKNLALWIEMLPDDVDDDFNWVEDAGERELLKRVAPIIAAIRQPPA